MFNQKNLIACWLSREKELKRILIKLIVSSMKMNHNSLIRCPEQWMLSILECPHLEANKKKKKTNISTSSLLKKEVSLELPTPMPMPIQRKLLKQRLLIPKELRFKDQAQLLNRVMITSIREPLLTLMRKAESKFLLISKSRANGPSVKQHQPMECTSSRSPISSLTRMRWVQS